MDADLKNQAETLFEDMGMNMTTAFTIFTKTVVRQGKIPFEVAGDPFYMKDLEATEAGDLGLSR
jgi:DNA-damage-inducible protein J